MFGEWLFRSGDLGAYLRQKDAAIGPHIARHGPKSDLSKTDAEIADHQLILARVASLTVDSDHPTKHVEELRVVVGDGFGG